MSISPLRETSYFLYLMKANAIAFLVGRFHVAGSYLDLHGSISSFLATLYSTCFVIYSIVLFAIIMFVVQYCKDGETQDVRCDKKYIFGNITRLRISQIDLSGLNR
jgi:hypothetical protein